METSDRGASCCCYTDWLAERLSEHLAQTYLSSEQNSKESAVSRDETDSTVYIPLKTETVSTKDISVDDLFRLNRRNPEIKQFILRNGVLNKAAITPNSSSRCICVQDMQNAVESLSTTTFEGKDLSKSKNSITFSYFAVLDYDKKTKSKASGKGSDISLQTRISQIDRFEYCLSDCPKKKEHIATLACSKKSCRENAVVTFDVGSATPGKPCDKETCTQLSPVDSQVEINLDELHNQCKLPTCDVVETVIQFIKQAQENLALNKTDKEGCVCDCSCKVKFKWKTTTYCHVCGGYLHLGDVSLLLPYDKPYPCPVFHNTMPEEEVEDEEEEKQ